MKKTADTKQLESDINEFTEIIGALKFALVRRNPKMFNEIDQDMTPIQFGLCMLLKVKGKQTMGFLSNAIGVSMPTITGIIDRLVKREIVKRDRDEQDRRVVFVALTQNGEKVLDAFHRVEHEHLKPVLMTLSQEDRHTFIKLWRQILTGLMPEIEQNEILADIRKLHKDFK